MVGVITGNVVNSRARPPELWLESIKLTLKKNKIPKRKWDIYRGDMFQIEVEAKEVLGIAIKLKASIREERDLDLRMALGIGTVDYISKNVQESNGEAYINSGQAFELLKKNNLKIRTPWIQFNTKWNMILDLASLTMDSWPPITATIFKTVLQKENKTQKEIAQILKKSPSSISEGLKRAGHDEIVAMINQFRLEIEIKTKQI